MASLTFAQLIQRTRELVMIFGASNLAFRDGLPADAGSTTLVPIGYACNEMISMCALLGANIGNKAFTMVASQSEYPVTLDVTRTIAFKFGKFLRKTTRDAKDSKGTGWDTRTGNPAEFILEGNNIIVIPSPDAASITLYGSAASMRCVLSIPPLVNGTDPVLYIPETMQYLIPYGAAYLNANIDAENPYQAKRLDGYRERGQELLDFCYEKYAEQGQPRIVLSDRKDPNPMDSMPQKVSV